MEEENNIILNVETNDAGGIASVSLSDAAINGKISDINHGIVNWSDDFEDFEIDDIVVYCSNIPSPNQVAPYEMFKIGQIKKIADPEIRINNFASDQEELYFRGMIKMSLLYRFRPVSPNAFRTLYSANP